MNGTAASPRGCKRGGLRQGGSALGMGMQPWQGRAEQARQAVPGKGGGHCRWPGPGPGGCASRRPRAPRLGHLPGGWGVLTSRAQHLEQLEVLHAHLLLMPRQVGCRHRGRMSPAVHDPSLQPPQPSPHPQPLAVPALPSVILSSTAQPSSSSSSPMASGSLGPAARLRAAPVTWRLQPGRELPGAASGPTRAPAPPPSSPPRGLSQALERDSAGLRAGEPAGAAPLLLAHGVGIGAVRSAPASMRPS